MKKIVRMSLLGLIFSVLLALAIILIVRRRPSPTNHGSANVISPATGLAARNTAPTATKSLPITGVSPNYPDFQARPFPVAYENANDQWTSADGKDTNIIRRLAHNRLEYDRMVEENSRIFKRQLVYLKETAASLFEQAKLTGQQVQELTLPGTDGQELQFQIVRSQGNGSSRQGMFSGHLAGNTDSLVTLAFEDGREAFTVLAPNENIFVVAEPREDGQVIVKAIDPNTYGMGPAEGDDAIKTAPLRN